MWALLIKVKSAPDKKDFKAAYLTNPFLICHVFLLNHFHQYMLTDEIRINIDSQSGTGGYFYPAILNR